MLMRFGVAVSIILHYTTVGTGKVGAFSFPDHPKQQLDPSAYASASASASLNNNKASSKSYVEIYDPTTQTNIVLLGCLHGSISSSRDVQYLMKQEDVDVDAVVLELCETRIQDLTRVVDTVDDYTKEVFWEDVQDFISFIKDTKKKKGLIVATVTFVLGMTSLLQTNISGVRAGLEFAVAVDIAEENDIPIFLGDRRIDQTMERISSLPSVSLEMIQNYNTIGVYTKLLQTAVLGDRLLPNDTQISLPTVLIRNKGAITDLARLALSPILIATIFAVSVGMIFHLPLYAEQESIDLLMGHTTTTSPLTTFDERLPILIKIISSFVTEVLVFTAGYTVLALPASKVIIHERDICLANEIHKACHDIGISSSSLPPEHQKQKNQQYQQPSTIVAVLGLLHVNGVAKQLLDNGAISIPPLKK